MAEFGKDIMKEFMLDASPGKAFLNHGSYGAAPRRIIDYRIRLIKEMEETPDVWFREKSDGMWLENIAAVSSFLGSHPENLVFIPNSTTGTNAILRSLKLKKGDAILLTSWTYVAVKNMSHFYNDFSEIELFYVKMPYPLKSVQQLVGCYEDMLIKHPNIKVVLLDFISSMPPVLMPLTELVSLFRKYNKVIVLDGAHTPGQLPLNLEQLGVDFYTGNLHKWLYAPRGCAVLWVSPKFHSIMFPAVISKYFQDKMWKMFDYQGTNDMTTFYSAKEAIRFYTDIGGYEKISNYCSTLVARGADLIVRKWKTEHFPLPESMKAPCMRLIRLPNLKKFPPKKVSLNDNKNAISDITDLLLLAWRRFHVQVAVVSVENEPWVRISANVYNVIEDYELLANAILSLLEEEVHEQSKI